MQRIALGHLRNFWQTEVPLFRLPINEADLFATRFKSALRYYQDVHLHVNVGDSVSHSDALRHEIIGTISLNRYTLGSDLVQVLVDRLRTPESLELAIERAAQLHSGPHPAPDRKQEYHRSDRLNRLAEFGFLAYVKLSDYDRAIDFFKVRYARGNPEITLFVLLQWLRSLPDSLLEFAVQRKAERGKCLYWKGVWRV
jgi:hypothetical protein